MLLNIDIPDRMFATGAEVVVSGHDPILGRIVKAQIRVTVDGDSGNWQTGVIPLFEEKRTSGWEYEVQQLVPDELGRLNCYIRNEEQLLLADELRTLGEQLGWDELDRRYRFGPPYGNLRRCLSQNPGLHMP